MLIPRPNWNSPEKKIIIFTGAGISAESGIQTFRDSGGLWENHKVEEICEEKTWKKNFELVHKFYNERRCQLKDCEPNETHNAISRIRKKYGDDCYVITQNIDNLLEKAGVDNLLHLHGNATELKCDACGHIWDIGYTNWDSSDGRCPKCKSHKGVRPNIVFFGGSAPMYSYLYRALEFLQNKNSILVVAGTMGNVIQIKDIIGFRQINEYKKRVNSFNILNNLNKSSYLPESLFDKIFYQKSTDAFLEIEDIIYKKF
jgi:NAD-dependent deacetylase